MPIYTFSCSRCGHIADHIVALDTKKSKCPNCGAQASRKGVEVPAKRNPAYGLQTDKR